MMPWTPQQMAELVDRRIRNNKTMFVDRVLAQVRKQATWSRTDPRPEVVDEMLQVAVLAGAAVTLEFLQELAQ